MPRQETLEDLTAAISEEEAKIKEAGKNLKALRRSVCVLQKQVVSFPNQTVGEPQGIEELEEKQEAPISDLAELLEAHTYGEGTFSAELTRAMVEVLWEEAPLRRRELVTRVQAKGIILNIEKPGNTMSSYLSSDARFVKTNPPGRWTLASKIAKTGTKNNPLGLYVTDSCP